GVRAGPEGLPAPIETGGRGSELAARAERRRERFPDRAALAAYYRSREGFSGWRQDYFDAFIHYGTQVNEDGSASPCVPPRAAARLLEATFDFEPWRDVFAPDVPVHVLFGERSGRLAPGRDPLAAIRLLFPRSESSVMPGATHTGPMEQPELFERELREFDASLRARGMTGL
ncbi:MAG TPA: alpha/beta hydrolase, partial [Dehalococcoidia bacterium]|nr:alpha/beta hydrolase [Dehalococcoidia bacterium]